MATLTTQKIARTGLTPSFTAAGGSGDKFHPGERTYLHVKNGDSSGHAVTLVTPGKVDGQDIAELVVTVPNGSEKLIGPLTPKLFGNPDDARLGAITYAATTSMTVAVIGL